MAKNATKTEYKKEKKNWKKQKQSQQNAAIEIGADWVAPRDF